MKKNILLGLAIFFSVSGAIATGSAIMTSEKAELERDLVELQEDIDYFAREEAEARSRKEEKIAIRERKICLLAELKVSDGELITPETEDLCFSDPRLKSPTR